MCVFRPYGVIVEEGGGRSPTSYTLGPETSHCPVLRSETRQGIRGTQVPDQLI